MPFCADNTMEVQDNRTQATAIRRYRFIALYGRGIFFLLFSIKLFVKLFLAHNKINQESQQGRHDGHFENNVAPFDGFDVLGFADGFMAAVYPLAQGVQKRI